MKPVQFIVRVYVYNFLLILHVEVSSAGKDSKIFNIRCP